MPLNHNQNIDQLASSYGKEARPDVEAALAAVKRRIAADASMAHVRKLPGRRRWLGIAASVLLVVAAGYFGLLRDTQVRLANLTGAPMEAVLPDGTQVVLQSETELTYDQDFNTVDRRITLKGQAFFEVYKDKTRPFLVANHETELRVTGTAFNLRVHDGELEVEVSEGSVELRKDSQVVPVKANQCGLSKAGEPSVVMDAPHLNRHAWRTGKLYFQDAEIKVVLEALRTNFGVEAALEGDCSYAISGTFVTDKPEAILLNVARLGGGEMRTVGEGDDKAYLLTGICQ